MSPVTARVPAIPPCHAMRACRLQALELHGAAGDGEGWQQHSGDVAVRNLSLEPWGHPPQQTGPVKQVGRQAATVGVDLIDQCPAMHAETLWFSSRQAKLQSLESWLVEL